MKEYRYLDDNTFLKQFDKIRLKEQFVKIIILNMLERPIQEVQGMVTGGSFNIDGNSNVRRTGNISLIATEEKNDLTDIDNLFSINKKVKVLIGYANNTEYYQDYPIIWYPKGTYVIVGANLSHELSGVKISLQLKDKMVLLNGECGGVFPAAVTLSEMDVENEERDENGNKTYTTYYPTIYQIIQEVVNHFGGEQLGKIIISDIDLRIKAVQKWSGSYCLYSFISYSNNNLQYHYDTNYQAILKEYNNAGSNKTALITYEQGDDIGFINTDFTWSDKDSSKKNSGSLTANAGENVCTILEKIKNALGNFEYFYDLDGNFIFQEKKNYLNNSKIKDDISKLENSDYLFSPNMNKTVYDFDDSTLTTASTNNPSYQNIKNDFIVWGSRYGLNNNKTAIRYHLAIDKKPISSVEYPYKDIYNKYLIVINNNTKEGKYYKKVYCGGNPDSESHYDESVEEYIYDIPPSGLPLKGNTDSIYFSNYEYTSDYSFIYVGDKTYVTPLIGGSYYYYYYTDKDSWDSVSDEEGKHSYSIIDFSQSEEDGYLPIVEIRKFGSQEIEKKLKRFDITNCNDEDDLKNFLPTNGTDFEDCAFVYNDTIWFWNNELGGYLYCYIENNIKKCKFYNMESKNIIFLKDSALNIYWRDVRINDVKEDPFAYLADWRTEIFLKGKKDQYDTYGSDIYYTELNAEWEKIFDIKNNKFYDEVLRQPQDINYFLDFIDSTETDSISIPAIGRRTKVLTDEKINCLFEPEIPEVFFIDNDSEKKNELIQECQAKGQYYYVMNHLMYEQIAGGGKYNSAYNAVREMLSQYTSYNEQVTLTTLPIHYLEPNTRISITDPQIGIKGDYMINTISFSLDSGSTMSINATRIIERL